MLLSYLNELLNGNYIKLVIVWQLQKIIVCLRQMYQAALNRDIPTTAGYEVIPRY
jgi:hypothetical protein